MVEITDRLTLAVITNPLSGKNRKSLTGLERQRQDFPGVRHFLASTPEEMEAAVEQVFREPVDVVAINGGDGTVSLVTTLMLRRRWSKFPVLALIGGGTTNMTAMDLGLSGSPVSAMGKLLEWYDAPDREKLVRRSPLRIEADGGAAHYGFFIGAGLIARGVARSLEMRARARRPEWVPPRLTASILGKSLLGLRPLGGPIAMAIESGEGGKLVSRFEAVFVSALEKLLLGFSPVPGGLTGKAFHWGALEANLPAKWRSLPAYLRGREHPLVSQKNGFHRGTDNLLTLDFEGEYIVDGEFFRVASRLRISAAETIEFLKL